MKISRYDVVIIGGGMTGLSTALSLHLQGFNICLIEAGNSQKALPDTRIQRRVSAVNRRSERFLRQLGVWDAIVAMGISPYFQMTVWDDLPEYGFSMTAQEAGESNLGYIIENDVITTALAQRADDLGIDVFVQSHIAKMAYENDKHVIYTENETIYADLIVGADGAKSFVRSHFDMGVNEKPYRHTAIVATVELEKPHQQTAYQRFYADGILAFLPLAESNRVSIVWSIKTEMAEQMMSLENDAFALQLKQAIQARFGSLSLLSPKFSFELIARHAKSYCANGVVLVGDSAHTIHPLAGQGVNLGLKDVIALTDVLIEAKQKQRNYAGLDVLMRYERKRRIDNQLTLMAMRGFKEGFTQDFAPLKWFRQKGLQWIDRQPWCKRVFIKEALGE